MALRSFLSGGVLLVVGLSAGCGGGPSVGTTQATSASIDACARRLDGLEQACGTNTSEIEGRDAVTLVSGLRLVQHGIASDCRDPANERRMAIADRCIAALDAKAQDEKTAAPARRTAAAPRVSEVRSDAAFKAALAEYRDAGADERQACRRATEAYSLDPARAEEARKTCESASLRRKRARETWSAVLARHQIDVRDARVLQLAP